MARLLLADIGNTRAKLAEPAGDALHLIDAWPTEDAARIPSDCDTLLVVSVVPEALKRWRESCAARVLQLGVDLQAPLHCDYQTCATLGQDRLAAATEAVAVHPGGALVLCAGTAVTLDWVDAGGVFRGGMIAPGRKALAQALASAAPALPRADVLPSAASPQGSSGFPARSSQACVDLGVDAAFTGLLRHSVEMARQRCGRALPLCIGGGDAEPAARVLTDASLVDELLTLRGLLRCHVLAR